MAISLQNIKTSAVLALEQDMVKQYLKIDNEEEDALLSSMIECAVKAFELHTNIALLDQEWRVIFKMNSALKFDIPMQPLKKITQIYAMNYSGVMHDMMNYHKVIGESVLLDYLPHQAQLSIQFLAGIAASADDIPSDIKHELLKHVAFLYQNRGIDVTYNLERYNVYKKRKI